MGVPDQRRLIGSRARLVIGSSTRPRDQLELLLHVAAHVVVGAGATPQRVDVTLGRGIDQRHRAHGIGQRSRARGAAAARPRRPAATNATCVPKLPSRKRTSGPSRRAARTSGSSQSSQIVPACVETQRSRTSSSRIDSIGLAERMVDRQQHVGGVGEQAHRFESVGASRAARVFQSWTIPRSAPPRSTTARHSRGSISCTSTRRSGAVRASRAISGATSPRQAVEKAAIRNSPVGARPSPSARFSSCSSSRQQPLALLGQQASPLAQDHAAPDVLEHRAAALALEPLDLLADRGRREAQRVGRADDACRGHARRSASARRRDRA